MIVVIFTGCTRLEQPSDLTATALNDSTIELSWIPRGAGQEGYYILEATDSSDFADAFRTEQDARTVVLPHRRPGTHYRYRVEAFKGEKRGEASEPVEVTTPKTIPAAPTNLTGKAIASSMIQIDWDDNSIGEAGFIVERQKDTAQTWREITRTGPEWTGITDSDLRSGMTYRYRVCAYNPNARSEYTKVCTLKTDEYKSIRVLFPNGGEVITHSPLVIKWETDPEIFYVKIIIFNEEGFSVKPGGMMFNESERVTVNYGSGEYMTGVWSKGEYIFDMVESLPASKTYKIRVSNPKTGRFDESDGYFEVMGQ